jgi:DNA-binding SARP family transcriptional activator
VQYMILGPLEVWTAEGPIALTGERTRIVLAALLLSRGTPVSSVRLIDDVWGADPPATARNQIQICVRRLRCALGDTVRPHRILRTRHPGYQLVTAEDEVDASQFRRWERQAEHAARTGDVSGALAALGRALSLWRGPALDGVDSDTARAAALHWNERHVGAWQRYAELGLAVGQHEHLIPGLRQLVQQYPLRERPHELFMIALYRAGAQGEALSVYRTYCSRIRESLGLDPGEGLRRLQQAILQHSAGLNGETGPSTAATFRPAWDVLPLGSVS